jgi:signal transduction histidine kinase/ActR/RegA family two-component response regulator
MMQIGNDESVQRFDRMRAEQVSALFSRVGLGVTGAAFAAVILGGGLVHLGAVTLERGAYWASYIVVCAAAHLLLARLYFSANPNDDEWKIWAAWFTIISFAEGVGWGAIALIGTSERFPTEMLILVVSLNIAGAAISAFGSYLPAFFAFFIPTTIPCAIWGIAFRDTFPESHLMLLLMLLYIVAMSGLGIRSNQGFKELVQLRIKASALADDLRRQKELAEQANLAKSHFLAAASHDLRQPIHALGLFVGALRGVQLPPEGLHFVDRIEQSTLAMDSLFSAILDISRLDAGVVEVQLETLAIQPLLNRICADQMAEASQKSIALVQRHCGLAVRTDPLLLERILRNILSNAVRHTDTGRIVVGCRRRNDMVRVEVWDTGPGIAAGDREHIFQEYFQLDNPERNREKGLGLGLAIVRRLANLLGCPISLRSEVGRGSCFSIEIPKDTLRITPDEGSVSPMASTPRGLILVIDDESVITEAMKSLLTGWGYDVIIADSGAQMISNVSKCLVRPSAIICDYRLRGEENGIDVIRLIQSEYNENVPAMLITGDTAADRLIEAKASGLLLLHKPVPNGKLRAAIANLIASSERCDDEAKQCL